MRNINRQVIINEGEGYHMFLQALKHHKEISGFNLQDRGTFHLSFLTADSIIAFAIPVIRNVFIPDRDYDHLKKKTGETSPCLWTHYGQDVDDVIQCIYKEVLPCRPYLLD